MPFVFNKTGNIFWADGEDMANILSGKLEVGSPTPGGPRQFLGPNNNPVVPISSSLLNSGTGGLSIQGPPLILPTQSSSIPQSTVDLGFRPGPGAGFPIPGPPIGGPVLTPVSPITPAVGGMMLAPVVVGARIAVFFTGLARGISTGGRFGIPFGARGFLTRVLQATGVVQVGQIFGIDLWPFNNSSERDQMEDLIAEALESGAINDNRGSRAGTIQPMRAFIAEFDRSGEEVEQMYIVSYHPMSPTAARRQTARTNVVRRRRTPKRRQS